MTIARDTEDAVRNYFREKMPERIKRLKNVATHDLWHGPMAAGTIDEYFEWPGWSSAIDELKTWCDATLCDVWVDIQCDGVMESEPQGRWVDRDDPDNEESWEEPCWEDIVHLDISDVKRLLFPNQLWEYIR